jgi:hypothetical protein
MAQTVTFFRSIVRSLLRIRPNYQVAAKNRYILGSPHFRRLPFCLIICTVKLGYNELGYNEHSVITNKNIYLVGLGHFHDKFSRL